MKIISRESDRLHKRIIYEIDGKRKILAFPNTDSFEDHEKQLFTNCISKLNPINTDPVPNTKASKKKPVK